MNIETAEQKFRRAHTEALGFIELAKMTRECNSNSQPMIKAAIAALEKVDDEVIDALYDADAREEFLE